MSNAPSTPGGDQPNAGGGSTGYAQRPDSPGPIDPGDPGVLDGPPRKGRRRVLRAILVLLVLAVSYYGVNLLQVWRVGNSDQARPVDAIVVMGAAQYDGRPSPQLQARLDHVVELWDRGLPTAGTKAMGRYYLAPGQTRTEP